MTRAEYLEWFKGVQAEQLAITTAKNADYAGAGGDQDAFANFKQIGHLLGDTKAIEIGFLTRMSDKMSRIASFVAQGSLQVKDESVSDTLNDLSIYCQLFRAYLKSEKDKLNELNQLTPQTSDGIFHGKPKIYGPTLGSKT